jgi:hypothetical protein
MSTLERHLRRVEAVQAQRWSEQLHNQLGHAIYPTSFFVADQVTAFLSRDKTNRVFGLIWSDKPDSVVNAFDGEIRPINLDGHALKLKLCPTHAANSVKLREFFPFTRPSLVGLTKSFGCGDRLGTGTPGHIFAGENHPQMRLVLAQQSIREMTRTERSAQQVMDDACWGVFQSGYEKPFGADADHLKTLKDIDVCVAAGFLMFTIDPGDHVDDRADNDDPEAIKHKFTDLPWAELESSPDKTLAKFVGDVTLPSETLSFTPEQVMRAAVKYGRAVAHTRSMYRHLVELKGKDGFELEVSVDETATPTRPQEHFYVAGELKRLGVKWLSLAPRFIGDFEKGVDYVGDLKAFRQAFARHVDIINILGPYKISIHSGSDKFSIYPIIAELAGELIHVKTAGTSYLEALRVLAQLEPELFRRILDFARERYETDRASYHVSAKLARVPPAAKLSDHELPRLLNEFDAREVLHVTFGSVMTTKNPDGSTRFRDEFLAKLCDHEEAYAHCLEQHIGKHMELLS